MYLNFNLLVLLGPESGLTSQIYLGPEPKYIHKKPSLNWVFKRPLKIQIFNSHLRKQTLQTKNYSLYKYTERCKKYLKTKIEN